MTASTVGPHKIIDFLPPRYREAGAKRQSMVWRWVVLCVFFALLAVGAVVQLHIRRSVEAELAVLKPLYSDALARTARLTQAQQELAKAKVGAELAAFTRHPWPRTRILEAVLKPLPDSIRLTEVRLFEEKRENAISPAAAQAGDGPAAGAAKTLEGAPRDLKDLREQAVARRTVVSLAGVADDQADLHAYLGRVSQSDLVVRADVLSIENNSSDAGSVFRAVVEIVQPHGVVAKPAPPAAASAVVPTPSSQPAA